MLSFDASNIIWRRTSIFVANQTSSRLVSGPLVNVSIDKSTGQPVKLFDKSGVVPDSDRVIPSPRTANVVLGILVWNTMEIRAIFGIDVNETAVGGAWRTSFRSASNAWVCPAVWHAFNLIAVFDHNHARSLFS